MASMHTNAPAASTAASKARRAPCTAGAPSGEGTAEAVVDELIRGSLPR